MKTEYEIVEIQFWKANSRRDYKTANKLAKTLSEYNNKNPELKKLFDTLFEL